MELHRHRVQHHVIHNSNNMKILYFIFIVSLTGYSQEKKDYEVAQKALFQLDKYQEFRLLGSPNNRYIDKCLNGFYAHSTYGNDVLDFRNFKFSYNSKPVLNWDNKAKCWGKTLSDKISIIDDFSKVPKVSLLDMQKANTYIALSNPAFSEDGNYAIIVYEVFTNIDGGDVEGVVLIFKKEKGEWVYLHQFTGYIS